MTTVSFFAEGAFNKYLTAEYCVAGICSLPTIDAQVDRLEQFLRYMQKLRFDLKFDPATREFVRERRERR